METKPGRRTAAEAVPAVGGRASGVAAGGIGPGRGFAHGRDGGPGRRGRRRRRPAGAGRGGTMAKLRPGGRTPCKKNGVKK